MACSPMPYLSYLLRLWQSGLEEPVWRASLENPSTGERHAFASLDLLVEFLRTETAALTLRQEVGEGEGERRSACWWPPGCSEQPFGGA